MSEAFERMIVDELERGFHRVERATPPPPRYLGAGPRAVRRPGLLTTLAGGIPALAGGKAAAVLAAATLLGAGTAAGTAALALHGDAPAAPRVVMEQPAEACAPAADDARPCPAAAAAVGAPGSAAIDHDRRTSRAGSDPVGSAQAAQAAPAGAASSSPSLPAPGTPADGAAALPSGPAAAPDLPLPSPVAVPGLPALPTVR